MKKKLALVLAVVLSMATLAGCGAKEVADSEVKTEAQTTEDGGAPATEEVALKEISIPQYKVGQNVGAKFFEPQVERFNEKYAGQYKITLEEIPQDSYDDKIKQLAQQNKLPALIEGADPEWFESYIIANKKYYDLSPWLESKPELKNTVLGDALAFNTRDGEVVTMPVSVARPIGLFYNKTMLNLTKPIKDMTIDEFTAEIGDNKLALMTSENAWTTMLLYSALLANEPGGPQMLLAGVTEKVTDYSTPIWINATKKLQEIAQNHASANSIGAAYADAANSFMSQNASVIFNGSWMVGDLVEGGEDKWSGGFEGSQVVSDIYPGNVAMDNVLGYSWWIPAEASEDDIEVALAFLEFINTQEELEQYMLSEGGVSPNLIPSDEFIEKQQDNRLLYELNASIDENTVIVPPAEQVMPNSVASQEFGKLLPKLFDGSLTAEEFCEQLTQKAKEAIQ